VKAEINEQILLQGLVNNDSKAIESIYKDNYNMIQAFILNNNGSYDDARDIFQEAMITLYEKAKSESFVLTCQIKTYIYSVCRRLWLKRLQQMGKYISAGENLEETVPVEEDLEIHEKRNAEFAIMERGNGKFGRALQKLTRCILHSEKRYDGNCLRVWLY
jgi:RNA polymerase sigma factor (sigma-70 family)